MWLGAIMPLGFGAWVPLVAGYRAGRVPWAITGVLTCALTIVALAFSSAEEDNRYGGGLIILAWIVAGAVSFALRTPYRNRMAARAGYEARISRAEHVDEERREMLALARRNPSRAVGLGVGRPDLPGTRHGHLVDVNHAGVPAIAGLPGVSDELAHEIVALREELGGFDSVEDLGALMALHPGVVEAMSTRAVALPD